SENRFGVDLIPGHTYLAIFEDILGAAWSQLRAGDRTGYRQTNWNNHLCILLENKYDLVLYDLGPSLG
ncbi:ParA family protein, partial [Salmonella enterica subsp. enterica serovar Infantis]